ncbi:hypothetical protein VNO77_11963 [Canavalia gladiata]|uniref:Uncharacterized protein n=1 Tax=Canavalia gladiata TaxID=3824 RepID=A0AAN9M0W9_CANGL
MVDGLHASLGVSDVTRAGLMAILNGMHVAWISGFKSVLLFRFKACNISFQTKFGVPATDPNPVVKSWFLDVLGSQFTSALSLLIDQINHLLATDTEESELILDIVEFTAYK